MRAQEAIEWIKAISAVQKESIHENSLLQRKEALHMAIKALQKQVPKRTITGKVMGKTVECCPECGLDNSDFGFNVCVDCGQRLDWSE